MKKEIIKYYRKNPYKYVSDVMGIKLPLWKRILLKFKGK